MKLGLNLENAKVIGSRVVVPTGNYPVMVSSADVTQTKDKKGHYIKVGFTIQSGDQKGVTVYDNLNIDNKNEDAVRIGLNGLKTILTVGGHNNPNYIDDTNEMIGLKLNLYIEEEPHSFESNGETVETTQNKIKSYYEFSEETAQTSSPETKKQTKTAASSPKKEETVSAPPAESKSEPAAQQSFPWMNHK